MHPFQPKHTFKPHAHPCAAQEPRDQAPVIVAGKDQGEVDNDYFLVG